MTATKQVLVAGKISKRDGKPCEATAKSSDWQCPLVSWGASSTAKDWSNRNA